MPIRLLDQKFRQYPWAYFLQSGLAAASVMVLLALHQFLDSLTLIAALGASTFTVFTRPEAESRRPRYLIGGYVCAVVVGVLCHVVRDIDWVAQTSADNQFVPIIMAGLSVGLTMFLMVVLNIEHAPAAGVTLGLVLDTWHIWNIAYVLGAILVLVGIKQLLRPYLKDLI